MAENMRPCETVCGESIRRGAGVGGQASKLAGITSELQQVVGSAGPARCSSGPTGSSRGTGAKAAAAAVEPCARASGDLGRKPVRAGTAAARLIMAAGHDFGLDGPLLFDSDYETY